MQGPSTRAMKLFLEMGHIRVDLEGDAQIVVNAIGVLESCLA